MLESAGGGCRWTVVVFDSRWWLLVANGGCVTSESMSGSHMSINHVIKFL